jgi:hypothetical protein
MSFEKESEWQEAFAPLWDRAIAPEVAEARGYVPYFGRHHPLHDPDGVRCEFDRYDLTPGQKSTLMRLTSGARDKQGRDGFGIGLLMHKHPFPGEPPILPQLRPEPVRTGGKTHHRHDKAFVGDPSRLERHLEEEHSGEDIASHVWHEHEDVAKYLLASRAKESVVHDHATDPAFQGKYGRRKLRQHVRSRHKGKDVAGVHTHRRNVAGQHVANRLDIHPQALERLRDAARVYLVLEGTPKADAVLSRIISTGEAASVLDVPSVTLWRAPELKRVCEEGLRGKDVVVVCDADWQENERVVRQALLLRERLRSHGVRSCVAAPPAHGDQAGALLYKGVDDFLAAGGGLDQLVVLDREAPRFPFALYVSREGRIRSTAVGLSPLLRVGKKAERVVEVLQDYMSQGFIAADRSLELDVDSWSGSLGWRGGREEWPTFTVRSDFRYTERLLPLADYAFIPTSTIWDVFREETMRHGTVPNLMNQLRTIERATAQRCDVTVRHVQNDSMVRLIREVLNDDVLSLTAKRLREKGWTRESIASGLGVSPRKVSSLIQYEPEPPADWAPPTECLCPDCEEKMSAAPVSEPTTYLEQRLDHLATRFEQALDAIIVTAEKVGERFADQPSVQRARLRLVTDVKELSS